MPMPQAPQRMTAVFGGNGFIGSHLVDQMVAAGHRVVCFDRFTPGKSPRLDHPADVVARVTGDFQNTTDVSRALDGVEVAFHLVSAFNPATSWNAPARAVEHDILATVRFLEVCVERGVRKVVFLSSGGTVYGATAGPADEQTLPRPFNPYGICKLAVEHFLDYFRTRHGLAADVYRPSNVYGPRQPLVSSQGVIAVWMRNILCGLPLEVYGDEATLRDYIYVTDVARLLGHSLLDLGSSETFNLSTGKGISILGLLRIFQEVVDLPFETRVHPRRASDNPSAVLSNEKIRGLYPDFVFQDLSERLRFTWDWVRRECAAGVCCGLPAGAAHRREDR